MSLHAEVWELEYNLSMDIGINSNRKEVHKPMYIFRCFHMETLGLDGPYPGSASLEETRQVLAVTGLFLRHDYIDNF